VRVPLGRALEAGGYGPFTIVNNQLACGARVSAGGRPLGETVLILNLGTAIEAAASTGKFSNLNHDPSTFTTVTRERPSLRPPTELCCSRTISVNWRRA